MAESDGCTLWYPHKPDDLYVPLSGVISDADLRDLIAKEEDNQRAVEDVVNNANCGGAADNDPPCVFGIATGAADIPSGAFTLVPLTIFSTSAAHPFTVDVDGNFVFPDLDGTYQFGVYTSWSLEPVGAVETSVLNFGSGSGPYTPSVSDVVAGFDLNPSEGRYGFTHTATVEYGASGLDAFGYGVQHSTGAPASVQVMAYASLVCTEVRAS